MNGPPRACRSGWTARSLLLATALVAVSALLGMVGRDTLRRGAGDAVCEALGLGVLGLALLLLAGLLVVVLQFSVVVLVWDARGLTGRARGVEFAASWQELREVQEVPFAHSRFSRPVIHLRGRRGSRRLVLRSEERTVVVRELFFPDFERLLHLLREQRAQVRHW